MVTSHVVTPVTPNMVTQHGYAICGYGGYARIWLRHMVTPRIVMSVTPYTITPHGYAGYAKFGYATWLRHACMVMSVTPYTVTPHGYATPSD